MTIEEKVLETLRRLPDEKKVEALRLISSLEEHDLGAVYAAETGTRSLPRSAEATGPPLVRLV